MNKSLILALLFGYVTVDAITTRNHAGQEDLDNHDPLDDDVKLNLQLSEEDKAFNEEIKKLNDELFVETAPGWKFDDQNLASTGLIEEPYQTVDLQVASKAKQAPELAEAKCADPKKRFDKFTAEADGIIRAARAASGAFTDSTFTESSLRRPNQIQQLSSKNPSFRGNFGIRPQGVGQGAVGDCWLIQAISAIAEHPERVERIMEEVDAEKGIYKVTLYANGRWVPVIIDNKLPTQYSGRMLKFVNPGNENGYALWAPLLEKAYAKLHINYQNQLSGGYNSEALYTLTGMPFVRYSIAVDGSNVDDIFAKATAADK